VRLLNRQRQQFFSDGVSHLDLPAENGVPEMAGLAKRTTTRDLTA
jgi:hypothetical protein